MTHHKLTPSLQLVHGGPITEADLHAYVDKQLDAERHAEVEEYLTAHSEKHLQVSAWRQQNDMLHALLDPVLEEAVPASFQVKQTPSLYPWRGLAASVALAVISASSAWMFRGSLDDEAARVAMVKTHDMMTSGSITLTGFARRAAVAHVVYSPDVRRPVEVGADEEQQLVAWLSKRLGTDVRPPGLRGLGYDLIGGRLLPGETGPVAQFMYHDTTGQRLTLYVTRELPKLANQPETSFRFGQDGPVNVFYWVDKGFGYAISGGADRQELMRVSQEVHRQLAAG